MDKEALFNIGELVEHQRFHYRGVVFDIDPVFSLSEEWYDAVALSKPPKDQPWYHVLVDRAQHATYVAERHLQKTGVLDQIDHPLLGDFFNEFIDGRYVLRKREN